MNYLYFKYLKNFASASSIPIFAGAAIFSLTSIQAAQAARITFSFTPSNESGYEAGAINNWGHGNGPNYGWVSGRNTGTATDSGTGLSTTFTGAPLNQNSTTNSNLVGSAQTNGENFKFDIRGLTTKRIKN